MFGIDLRILIASWYAAWFFILGLVLLRVSWYEKQLEGYSKSTDGGVFECIICLIWANLIPTFKFFILQEFLQDISKYKKQLKEKNLKEFKEALDTLENAFGSKKRTGGPQSREFSNSKLIVINTDDINKLEPLAKSALLLVLDDLNKIKEARH